MNGDDEDGLCTNVQGTPTISTIVAQVKNTLAAFSALTLIKHTYYTNCEAVRSAHSCWRLKFPSPRGDCKCNKC